MKKMKILAYNLFILITAISIIVFREILDIKHKRKKVKKHNDEKNMDK